MFSPRSNGASPSLGTDGHARRWNRWTIGPGEKKCRIDNEIFGVAFLENDLCPAGGKQGQANRAIHTALLVLRFGRLAAAVVMRAGLMRHVLAATGWLGFL